MRNQGRVEAVGQSFKQHVGIGNLDKCDYDLTAIWVTTEGDQGRISHYNVIKYDDERKMHLHVVFHICVK